MAAPERALNAADCASAMSGRLFPLSHSGTPIGRLPRAGSVLAFDFGAKRIGVAVGEIELRIAHPVTVIPAEPKVLRYRETQRLVDQWRPVLFAVGLPLRADGTASAVAPLCRKFARSLEGRFHVPALMVDEHLTSAAAATALGAAGKRGRAQNSYLDAAAAAEILATLFAQIDGFARR